MRPPPGGHIRQPKKSEICGQACIAMACGVTIAAAKEAAGRQGPTRAQDLLKAFRALRENSPTLAEDAVHRNHSHDPKPWPWSILRITQGRGGGHWVLLWNGVIYDPAAAVPGDCPTLAKAGMAVRSYLKLFPRAALIPSPRAG